MEWLASLGLRTVFDLRTAPERERRAKPRPGGRGHRRPGRARRLRAGRRGSLLRPDAGPAARLARLADGASERFFVATYRDLVSLPSARLSAMSPTCTGTWPPTARPALVHCTTGKDRNGWAVAVLLRFLGVPQDVVMEEYLRSDAGSARPSASSSTIRDQGRQHGPSSSPSSARRRATWRSPSRRRFASTARRGATCRDGWGWTTRLSRRCVRLPGVPLRVVAACRPKSTSGSPAAEAGSSGSPRPARLVGGGPRRPSSVLPPRAGRALPGGVVRFARDNGFPASPRRIFRLRHCTDELERIDEVGQVESQDRREVIVAILEGG